jgi:RNA polymerase sigma-70 factor (ECF subfamily)
VANQVLERGTPFAPFARPALVNGAAGAIVAPGGRLRAVVGFTVEHGRIVAIDVVADPAKLRGLDAG